MLFNRRNLFSVTRAHLSAQPKLRPNYFALKKPYLPKQAHAAALERHSYGSREEEKKQKTKGMTPSELLNLVSIYSQLSKARLATLVVLTSMAGYAMAPTTCSASPSLLLSVGLGTALCAASANTFNQLFEIPYDAKMTRTKSRPLVTTKISPSHAACFGLISGLAGTGILYGSSDTILPAAIGAGNILLYALVYTPMKRISYWNTWIGSVVGALPPLIGYTSLYELDSCALLLSAILFSWQFPHFNALSHNIRFDYKKAGYKMLSWINEDKNALVALRHSLLLIPMCSLLSILDICHPMFAVTSLIPNLWLSYWSYKFYHSSGKDRDRNAKNTFYASLFHLPLIIILMMLHKKHWKDDKKSSSVAMSTSIPDMK